MLDFKCLVQFVQINNNSMEITHKPYKKQRHRVTEIYKYKYYFLLLLIIIVIISKFIKLPLIINDVNKDEAENLQIFLKQQAALCETQGTENCHEKFDFTKIVHHFKYDFIVDQREKCAGSDGIYVLYLIKSDNFQTRRTIRETWGNDTNLADYKIKKVFLVGVDHENKKSAEELKQENDEYNDMIIADFYNKYNIYNLTVKGFMGINWARTHCSGAKYYLYLDENVYVSRRNLLNYLSDEAKFNPCVYFAYQFKEPAKNCKLILYAGQRNDNVKPNHNPSSINYIPARDCPYEFYPPHVNGHAILFNKAALDQIHVASYVTKVIRLDDVYFGFCVQWMGLKPSDIPPLKYVSINLNIAEDVKKYIVNHVNNEEMKKNFDVEKALYGDQP